ncbi:MAG: ShlB/FhaC/HecB family hemolysin secretion/activation protein [Pseudomonadota bacterium]|nr:ShlB/FhaC/HecB family hemolysin secretion/activation protein [Pseudomonadota bacterium]
MHGASRIASWWLLGHLCFTSASWAQPLPKPDAHLQRQQEQLDQLRDRHEAAPTLPLRDVRQPDPGLLQDEHPCRTIQHVQIIADPTIKAALRPHLAGPRGDNPPEGRCLGGQGIETLINRLRNRLVELGYITSTVSAPAQDLSKGTLQLVLQLGQVGADNWADSPLSAARLPMAHRGGAALNLRDLEQTLENLRRIPDAEVKLDIQPGQADNTSDIAIQFKPVKPLRLSLGLDDAGTRGTGKWQASATAHWDNPTGNADQFYINLSPTVAGKQAGPRGSTNLVAHYSLPVGYWSIGATVSRNRYHQTIAGAYQSYVYSGQSSQAELQLTRVLHRGATSKTQASIKAFARRSSNFIDDTEVQVQRRRTGGWELGVSHLAYIGQGVLDLQWSYRRGTGAFGAMEAPEEHFGEGSARMKLMQLSATWQQPFTLGQTRLRYQGQWRLQHNMTPLTPQDKFCAGGRYTVRGFDGEQNACGDRGLLWRNELSAPLHPGGPQMYLALDYARLHRSQHQVAQTLAGTAIGLRHGWALWGGHAHIEAFVGTPLKRPQHLAAAKATAGVQLHWAY